MIKDHITGIFRSVGLMHSLDQLKYFFQKIKYRKKNRQFKIEFPEVKLPEDYALFESFKLDYRPYYFGGLKTAKWLTTQISPFIELKI